jgi:pro-kumamolisin-like protein
MSSRHEDDRTRRLDTVASDSSVAFELVLRYSERNKAQIAGEAERLLAGGTRTPPADAEKMRAADPADVEIVRAFARHAGFTVVAVDEATRSVQLEGTAAAIKQAFGVTLTTAGSPGQLHREFDGSITLPKELTGIVVAILNLSTKPVAFNR